MTVLGRLIELALDASVLSAAVSSVRRVSGFRVPTAKIASPVVRQYAERYLGFGEALAEKALESGHEFRVAYRSQPLGDACKTAFDKASTTGWRIPADGVRYVPEPVATPKAAPAPSSSPSSAAKPEPSTQPAK